MHHTSRTKPMKNASKARRRQYQFLAETAEHYAGTQKVEDTSTPQRRRASHNKSTKRKRLDTTKQAGRNTSSNTSSNANSTGSNASTTNNQ